MLGFGEDRIIDGMKHGTCFWHLMFNRRGANLNEYVCNTTPLKLLLFLISVQTKDTRFEVAQVTAMARLREQHLELEASSLRCEGRVERRRVRVGVDLTLLRSRA